MFCQNCGNPIDEGLRFCGKCGAPVPQEEVFSSTPGSENNVAEESAVAEVEQTVQTEETAEENSGFNVVVPEEERETEDNSFLNAPQDPPKRKRKFVKVLAIILSILVVLGTCGFIFKDYLLNLWYWTTMSSDEKLQYAFQKQATAAAGSLSDVYSGIIDATSEEYSVEGSVSVEVSETVLALAGGNVPFNSASVDYSLDYLPGLVGVKLSYSLGEDSILTIECYVDFENKKATLCIPELSKQGVQFDISDLGDIYSQSDIEEAVGLYDQIYDSGVIYDVLPDEELIEDLLPDLVDAALAKITNVSEDDCDFTAAGVTESLTRFTANISENTLHQMLLGMLEELRDNEDIKDYIQSLPEKLEFMKEIIGVMPSGSLIYSAYTEAINMALIEARDFTGSDDVIATLRTYVNFDFEIVALEFEVPSSRILFSYGDTADGDDRGTEMKLEIEGKTLFSIVGKGTESGDEYTGKITVNAPIDVFKGELAELLVIECRDFDVDSAEDGVYSGEIEISLGKDAKNTITSEMTGGSGLGNFADPSILFKFADTSSSIDRSIVIKLKGEELVTLRTAASESDSASVDIPTNVTTDVDGWANDISPEYFTKLFEKWGIPLDDLSGLGDSYSSYDDYFDSDFSYEYDDYDDILSSYYDY